MLNELIKKLYTNKASIAEEEIEERLLRYIDVVTDFIDEDQSIDDYLEEYY